MDCCLVPFLPAVMATVEQLEELEQQLKVEQVPFASDASIHLTEMSAAVPELEAARFAARELLEAESIENSKLRARIQNTRECMNDGVIADVAAVRESNKKEMEELHKELNICCQRREDAANKLQDLLNQNKSLYAERKQVKTQREGTVADLNDKINLRSSLEKQLEKTQESIEEVKSSTALVKQEIADLEESMALERKAYSEQNNNLSGEVSQVEEQIKQQKEVDKVNQQKLARIRGEKDVRLSRLRHLKSVIVDLDNKAQRLKSSWCSCDKMLNEEFEKHSQLLQQIYALNQKECCPAVAQLRHQISEVECKLEKAWTLKRFLQETLPQLCEKFKQQQVQKEQFEVELPRVAQKLQEKEAMHEALPLQIENHLAFMVRQRKKISAMEEQIHRFLETEVVSRRIFKRKKEQLCRIRDAEKKEFLQIEMETAQMGQLLQEALTRQEEYENKVRADIINLKRRYAEALQELDVLYQQVPLCKDVSMLESQIAQSQKEYKKKESSIQKKIQKLITETESLTKNIKEKEKEKEEKEVLFKDIEDRFNEAQSNNEKLKEITTEQSMKMNKLQASSRVISEETILLQGPKESMKAELEELRQVYIDLLDLQGSELRTVEVNIYNSGVNLEQVSMENNRLHFSIRQMTDEIQEIRDYIDQNRQDVQLFSHKTTFLFENMQEGFREIR